MPNWIRRQPLLRLSEYVSVSLANIRKAYERQHMDNFKSLIAMLENRELRQAKQLEMTREQLSQARAAGTPSKQADFVSGSPKKG